MIRPNDHSCFPESTEEKWPKPKGDVLMDNVGRVMYVRTRYKEKMVDRL
jgi:hypothetical protein